MKRLLLVLSLSGTIVQAIEPVIIQDVNGIEIKLDQFQRHALKRCETLKPLLDEKERPEVLEDNPIDFASVKRSFITQANMQQLADIIIDSKEIAKITDHKKILELFQLADYVMAPKKIVRLLAADAKAVIAERAAQLNALTSINEEQAEELYNLRVAQQSRENNKFDINGLLRKIDKNPARAVSHLYRDITCDLSYESIKKISKNKLQSLNGIEKLATDYRINHKINLDNQDIEKVDLGKLQKRFPYLHYLSLKNNLIEHVSETGGIRKLEVDLTANPLKSITIKKPELCNYLRFKTDNPEVKVDFVQNIYSRKLTWLKSLAAKVKIARECYLPSVKDFSIGLGACMCAFGIVTVLAEFRNRQDDRKALEELVLVNDQKILLRGDLLAEFKGQQLSHMVEKYGQARIVALKEVTHLLPPVLTPSYKKVLLIGAVGGALFATGLTAIGSVVIAVVDTAVNYYGGSAIFSGELNSKIEKNPSRITVETANSLIKTFPSNYTYKLFEKN